MTKKILKLCILSITLSLSGCVEGPTVSQDAEIDIPDGKTLVIISHFSFLDRNAEQMGMTTEEYEQYLLSVFGETRDIVLVRSNGSFEEPTVIAEFEIATIANQSNGGNCDEIEGARIRLDPGTYGIYDYEVSGEFLNSFNIRTSDYLEDCRFERISHRF